MSIPLSCSSPNSEIWLREGILNQNQNKLVKAKRQQAPTKNNLARNRHWNSILAILLVERNITPPPQPIRMPHVYHLSREIEQFEEGSSLFARA